MVGNTDDKFINRVLRKFKKKQFSVLDYIRGFLIDYAILPARSNCARKPRLLYCNLCEYLCRIDSQELTQAIRVGYDIADNALSSFGNAWSLQGIFYDKWSYPPPHLLAQPRPVNETIVILLGMALTGGFSGVFGAVASLRELLLLMRDNPSCFSEGPEKKGDMSLRCGVVDDILDDLYGPLLDAKCFDHLKETRKLKEMAVEKYKQYRFSLDDFAIELEALGVKDGPVHAHCLQKIHMRGCWLIDLFLTGVQSNQNIVSRQTETVLSELYRNALRVM